MDRELGRFQCRSRGPLRSLWLAALLSCSTDPTSGVDPVAGQGPRAKAEPTGPAPIADAPGLQLVPAALKLVMRAPREPAEGLIRVTGYRSMDYETGISPVGEAAVLNRVVELPEGQTEVLVTLQLATELYYQASFGPGEVPQKGDWMGPMTQWLGTEKFFLLVGNMKIE